MGRKKFYVPLIAAMTVTFLMLGTALAFAATIETDAVLSTNVSSPTQVSIGDNAFDIKVWATGTLPSGKSGVANVVDKYNMATDGAITPDSSSTTMVIFTVNYNYSGCPTTGTIPQGCPGNPFVVSATLTVASDTPDNTDGTVTTSGTGSSGLDWDATSTPDTGYVEVDASVVCTPDAITGPANVGVTYGDNATFAVTGVSSPQWQVKPSGGSTFTNISGATSASLTLTKPTVAMSGNQYQVVGVDSCGSAVTAGPATLTVNAYGVTVTASSPTVTYGDGVPTITPSYSGFVSPDTAPATAPTCSTTYTQGSHVDGGPYTTSCSGAADANYSFSYVGGTVTVNKAGLTVTASSPTVTYGDAAPAITPSYSGFVLSETASVLNTAPTCSTTYTQGSHVDGGPYTTSCSGGVDNDYSFSSYTDGTVTVNKAVLTVTADNKSIYLGQSDPAFTFQYSGFVLSEGAGVLGTAPTCGVAAHSGVGTFPIVCLGGVDNDYSFTYVNGTLSVTYGQDGLGIRQPINVDNTSLFSRGRAVPVKFGLLYDAPNGFDTTGWTVTAASVSCQAFDLVDATAEVVPAVQAGGSIRYDSTADQYIYNADFRSKTVGTCWRVFVNFTDGSKLGSAIFKLTK